MSDKDLSQCVAELTSVIDDETSREKISNFLVCKFDSCQSHTYSVEVLFKFLPDALNEECEDDLLYNPLVIQLLVKCGAEINSHDNFGEAVLLTVVKQNKFSIVKTLLECGANINVMDEFGKTPLIVAAQNNRTQTALHFLKHYKPKIKLDAVDMSNYTALCYSVNNNNMDVSRALLDSGANPNVSNISPLFLAIRNNSSIRLIQCLIDEGASLKIWMDISGVDFLVLAARLKRYDVVVVVVECWDRLQ